MTPTPPSGSALDERTHDRAHQRAHHRARERDHGSAQGRPWDSDDDGYESRSSRDDQRPPEKEEQEERKGFFGLSIPQLLGGAFAAVSTAVVASFLGVAGTLIGAAFTKR